MKGFSSLIPDQVLYEDKKDAKRASNMMGCGDTHSHSVDGTTHYMPCKSHGKFHDSIGMDSGMSSHNDGSMSSHNDSGSGVYDPEGLDFFKSADKFGSGDPIGMGSSGVDQPTLEHDSGEQAPDPYGIGNFGSFGSHYSTDEEEK
jgi:hypothetical protein